MTLDMLKIPAPSLEPREQGLPESHAQDEWERGANRAGAVRGGVVICCQRGLRLIRVRHPAATAGILKSHRHPDVPALALAALPISLAAECRPRGGCSDHHHEDRCHRGPFWRRSPHRTEQAHVQFQSSFRDSGGSALFCLSFQ